MNKAGYPPQRPSRRKRRNRTKSATTLAPAINRPPPYPNGDKIESGILCHLLGAGFVKGSVIIQGSGA